MWFYPVLTLLTIAAMVGVLISMGIRDDTQSQLFLSLLALGVVLAAYPLNRRLRRGAPLPAAAPSTVRSRGIGSPRPLRDRHGLACPRRRQRDGRRERAAGRVASGSRTNAMREYFVCVPGAAAAHRPGGGVVPRRHGGRGPAPSRQVLSILRGEGLRVEGDLGDYRPLHAMDDAVREFRPDLIVISTHPEERSNWLRQDIVERAKSKYGVAVRHIVSHVPEEVFGAPKAVA